MSHSRYYLLGNCKYDADQQKLLDANGGELKIRPQSLAVLDLLVSKSNQLVTKDEIFQTVWPDVVVSDDSLVQCIGDIRRALEDDKHSILITLPRRGYKLAAELPPQPVAALTTEKHETTHISPGNMRHKLTQVPAVFSLILIIVLGVVAYLGFGNKAVSTSEPARVAQQKSIAPTDIPSLTVTVNSDNNATDEAITALLQELKVALGYYSTVQLHENDQSDYVLRLNSHQFGKKNSARQVTVELRDSQDAALVFAESYDVSGTENAISQVAIRAAAAVASPGLGALARHLRETSRLKPVEELTPAECYVHGYGCAKCSGEEDNITQRAEACLAHLIEKNPDDARAWALQATIHAHQYWYGNTLPEPQRSTLALRKHLPEKAIAAANKAEALSSGGDSSVYWGMVEAYMASCQPDKLKAAIERGLEINPYDPNLLASFGNWLSYSGRWREGAALTRRALEIEPKYYRKWWWMGLAKTHYRFDEDQQAYEAFMKAFNERNWVSHLQLAYTLPYLGREDEAKSAVKNMLRLYPGVTLERALEFYKVLCFDDVFLSKMKNALVIAGLPSRGSSADFNNIRPPTAKTIAVNGIDTEYMDVGQGEPVVFVHGAAADYRTWGYYLLPISEQHRYISYSRRYHGTQPWSDSGEKHSAATYADDLTAFIEALDIGPVHLVTWSNAAPIAYQVKFKRPELIKSAIHYEPVTIDPLIGDIPIEKAAREKFFETWTAVFAQLKAGDIEGAGNRFMETVFELGNGEYRDEKEITKELFRQNARTLPVMFNPDYRKPEGMTCDSLQKTTTPTLIVHGEKTNQYWSLMARKFAECTPGARLKMMEGVNHKAPIEDFETFSGLIIDFVEEHK